MLRYHITVINDPLFFVLISRIVSWLCVRVGQIRQNVSRPFSAPLIPSATHAHLCLFVPGGRHRKLLEISSMNILYIFQYSSNISTLQGRFDQMLRRAVSTKERKKPPLPRDRRQSLSKKPRRVCRPQAANKVQSVFCGGVYVAKIASPRRNPPGAGSIGGGASQLVGWRSSQAVFPFSGSASCGAEPQQRQPA